MAMKKRADNLFIRGIAVYPKTSKPYKWDNVAKRSVPDPQGEYEITVAVSEEDMERHKATMTAFALENKIKKPDLPIKAEEDEEGNETGLYLIKAKQFGTNKDGTTKRIGHFDSAAKPLSKDFVLTGGSEVILCAYMSTREMPTKGVKLNISAIQVINYVEYHGNNPFDTVEGGFVANASNDDNEGDKDAPFDNDDGDEEDTDPTDF